MHRDRAPPERCWEPTDLNKRLAPPGSRPLTACLAGLPAVALWLLSEVEVPSPGPHGAWLPLRVASSPQRTGRLPSPLSRLGSEPWGPEPPVEGRVGGGAHSLHFSQVSLLDGIFPPHPLPISFLSLSSSPLPSLSSICTHTHISLVCSFLPSPPAISTPPHGSSSLYHFTFLSLSP